MKMNKVKSLACILLSVILLSSSSVLGVTKEVKAYRSVTQSQAVAYVKSLKGQYIDADGAYGAQCVDLIMKYLDFLGIPRIHGNANQYSWVSLPKGLTRYAAGSTTPQPGDILVTKGSSIYGHVNVAVVTSGNSITTIDQNYAGHSYVEEVQTPRHQIVSIIRPTFSDASKAEWIKDSKGWWYKHADGGYTTSDWEKINGYWYYFDNRGYMATGWQQIGGYWYYLDAQNGDMKTGWQKINNTWYYLKSSGDMATGWQQIGGYWYYLDVQNGDMKIGWQKINNNWYYVNNSGQMLNKWQKINGSWYYLNDSMYENTWVGGYYLKNGGAMASRESLWIDGKYYMFDEDGKVINT